VGKTLVREEPEKSADKARRKGKLAGAVYEQEHAREASARRTRAGGDEALIEAMEAEHEVSFSSTGVVCPIT
jgi:hypothetical protein